VKFTVAGRPLELEHQDVLDRLKGKEPKAHGRQTHFITVGRKAWPVKAALAEATGLDIATFPTSEAIRVLTRLGFPSTRRQA
jgi:hypothetical protein